MANTQIQANRSAQLRALVEAAVLIALAFVLSYIRVIRLPQGGSVTAVSMLPILLIGYRRGLKWGLGAGLVFGLLQVLQDGGIVPPTSTFSMYALVFLLDYFVAFGVLGIGGFFSKMKHGLIAAVTLGIALRFLCHFLSGIIVWGVFAWEGYSVVLYSFLYNGSYMGLELVFTIIAAVPISIVVNKIKK